MKERIRDNWDRELEEAAPGWVWWGSEARGWNVANGISSLDEGSVWLLADGRTRPADAVIPTRVREYVKARNRGEAAP